MESKESQKAAAVEQIVRSENYPVAFYRESHALEVGAGRGFDAGYAAREAEQALHSGSRCAGCQNRLDYHHETGCATCWQIDRPCYQFQIGPKPYQAALAGKE